MHKDLFKILKDIGHNQNGVVTEIMENMGVNYSQNNGANIFIIKKIASKYSPDNSLALELVDMDIREATLIASYLTIPKTLTIENIELILSKCSTTELCEHFVKNSLSKSNIDKEKIFEYCNSDSKLIQYSGYLLLYRNITADINFEKLSKVINNSINQPNSYIERSIINLLVKIANTNEVLRLKVNKYCENLSDDIATEVKAFLGEH